MHEHIELPIDKLLLDLENPRLDSVSSQSEALAGIVRLNRQHFRGLMISIRDEGLDPGDNLYVVRSENDQDFVVLDGNRRLAALKVLSNPDVLAGTDLPAAMKKPLLQEAKSFERSKVEPIPCVRFDHREEANDWIRRRHTGVMHGEGRMNWKPLEIQKFSGDYTTIDVIEFVERNGGYSQKELKKVQSMLGEKSTNLTRLLESKAGQSHLGITVQQTKQPSRKTPLLGVEPNWALKVLKRIVDDIVDNKVNSRNLNKASDIKKYFENLPPELQQESSDTAADAPKAFRDIILPGGRSKISRKRSPKTKPAPRTRYTLAPKKHRFDAAKSRRLSSLVKEAEKLNVKSFPFSCAFVLRAIVELAVNDYIREHSLQAKRTLVSNANLVLEDIVKSERVESKKDLEPFRRNLLVKDSPYSIQALNEYVHGHYAIPTADALRAGWESVIPVLLATYGNL